MSDTESHGSDDNEEAGTRDLPDILVDTSGTVRLINATFYAHHGVMREEHRIGNRYEVDVIMHFDFHEAARQDSLALTVDYAEVYEVVNDIVTKNTFYLIERLAFLIGQGVMAAQPKIDAIEVNVRKHNPPVGGTCDRAEATFRGSRGETQK
jgi:dihydroneopterin aldolase